MVKDGKANSNRKQLGTWALSKTFGLECTNQICRFKPAFATPMAFLSTGVAAEILLFQPGKEVHNVFVIAEAEVSCGPINSRG